MKKAIFALMAAFLALPFNASAKKDKPADIKVISYNIRVGKADDGTNSWKPLPCVCNDDYGSEAGYIRTPGSS